MKLAWLVRLNKIVFERLEAQSERGRGENMDVRTRTRMCSIANQSNKTRMRVILKRSLKKYVAIIISIDGMNEHMLD